MRRALLVLSGTAAGLAALLSFRTHSLAAAAQAASTRRIRSASAVCQTIESQSVSSTISRPPGRSTRRASASAPATSSTYSSTWVETTTSKLSSATGSSSRPGHRDRIRSRMTELTAARAASRG